MELKRMLNKYVSIIILSLGIGFYAFTQSSCKGAVVNEEKMCQAIYKAEGYKIPFGIKSSYCFKYGCSPKMVCLHTIRHYWRDYAKNNGRTINGFIAYASRRYVSNSDRIGQENWLKNVSYYYNKE